MAPEPVAVIVDRIHAALGHVPAERLVIAPDCGFKYFQRAEARAKSGSADQDNHRLDGEGYGRKRQREAQLRCGGRQHRDETDR